MKQETYNLMIRIENYLKEVARPVSNSELFRVLGVSSVDRINWLMKFNMSIGHWDKIPKSNGCLWIYKYNEKRD